MRKIKTIKERLLAGIEIVTESGCWVWVRATDSWGYGHMHVGKKKISTHRLSYMEFVDEIPKGLCVCHRCDIPACVNPNHLFLGTHQDNATDKVKKGRSFGRKGKRTGEGNPAAKLTEKDVLKIRASSESKKALSEKYGVIIGTIASIKAGRSWKHI